MFCKKCGKQIDDDAIFCPYCGTKISQATSEKEVLLERDNIESKKKENKRKEFFDGEIHKCPNCGEMLKAFETKCPSCGYELRGSKGGTNKVEELSKKLEKTKDVAQKKELISNFYVPNTREDIIEFFTLAVSQIDDSNECSEAWINKLEQTLMKAKLSFGETSDYEYLNNEYIKAKKRIKSVKTARFLKKNAFLIVLLTILVVGVIFIAVGCTRAKNYDDVFESPYSWMVFVGMFTCIGDVWGFLFYFITWNNKREAAQELEKIKAKQASKQGSKKTTKKSTTKASKKVEIVEEDEEEDDEDDEDEEEDDDSSESDEDEEEDDEDDEDDEDEEETEGDDGESIRQQFKNIGKEIKDSFKDIFKQRRS